MYELFDFSTFASVAFRPYFTTIISKMLQLRKKPILEKITVHEIILRAEIMLELRIMKGLLGILLV